MRETSLQVASWKKLQQSAGGGGQLGEGQLTFGARPDFGGSDQAEQGKEQCSSKQLHGNRKVVSERYILHMHCQIQIANETTVKLFDCTPNRFNERSTLTSICRAEFENR